MFESALKEKIKTIFDLKRVDFARPSESQEQEVAFVSIDKVKTGFTDARENTRVEGRMSVFAQQSKMPHGYFARRIISSKHEDVKDFFFFDVDENAGTYREIDVRSLSFVFFFSSQYDPDQGKIVSIQTNVEVTE